MTLWPFLLLAAAAPAPDKIVFDTDCGFFGDDGSALAMVLRSPENVQVTAITTVSGNVWAAESAGFVTEILGLLGRSEIKTYSGAQMPLVHTAAMAKLEAPVEFDCAFSRPVKLAPPSQPAAIDVMAAAIAQNPGQITILALGPMTNVALLLRLHPDLETRIKRIVFMGGNVHVPGNASSAAEFNFWFDPEAAQIVLRSRIPAKIMFPLDICNHAVLTKARFDEIVAARTPITDRYKEDYGQRYPGFLKNPQATGYLWDELAAAWLLDAGFVTKSETQWLDVDTRFGKAYGATVPLDRKFAPDATPVRVMLDLNYPRLWTLYKRLLTAR
ncbi:MAG TPA: nucleoside hydrolase [Bryobacteraceae bacterium]|nr:nucleoside hydrolase [Bryobacteraceae bacterium]